MEIWVELAEFNEIETKRLLLRPFRLSDTGDMFEYASDAKNLKFIFPPHLNKNATRLSIVEHFMKEPLGKWAIELKEEEKMIGSIDFVSLDEEQLTTEIGYVLNRKYWKKGLMTEAVFQLTNFSFCEFGLKCVDIIVDKENIGSRKVAEKVGYNLFEEYKAANKYTREIRNFVRYRMGKNDYDKF